MIDKELRKSGSQSCSTDILSTDRGGETWVYGLALVLDDEKVHSMIVNEFERVPSLHVSRLRINICHVSVWLGDVIGMKLGRLIGWRGNEGSK